MCEARTSEHGWYFFGLACGSWDLLYPCAAAEPVLGRAVSSEDGLRGRARSSSSAELLADSSKSNSSSAGTAPFVDGRQLHGDGLLPITTTPLADHTGQEQHSSPLTQHEQQQTPALTRRWEVVKALQFRLRGQCGRLISRWRLHAARMCSDGKMERASPKGKGTPVELHHAARTAVEASARSAVAAMDGVLDTGGWNATVVERELFGVGYNPGHSAPSSLSDGGVGGDSEAAGVAGERILSTIGRFSKVREVLMQHSCAVHAGLALNADFLRNVAIPAMVAMAGWRKRGLEGSAAGAADGGGGGGVDALADVYRKLRDMTESGGAGHQKGRAGVLGVAGEESPENGALETGSGSRGRETSWVVASTNRTSLVLGGRGREEDSAAHSYPRPDSRFQIWDTQTGLTPNGGITAGSWRVDVSTADVAVHSRVRGQISALLDQCTRSLVKWSYLTQGEVRMINAEDDLRKLFADRISPMAKTTHDTRVVPAYPPDLHPRIRDILLKTGRLTPLLRRLHVAVCGRLRMLKTSVLVSERVLDDQPQPVVDLGGGAPAAPSPLVVTPAAHVPAATSSSTQVKNSALTTPSASRSDPPQRTKKGASGGKALHVRLLLTAWRDKDIVLHMRPIQLWRCYADAQGYEFVVETNSPEFLLTEEEKVDRGLREPPRNHFVRGGTAASSDEDEDRDTMAGAMDRAGDEEQEEEGSGGGTKGEGGTETEDGGGGGGGGTTAVELDRKGKGGGGGGKGKTVGVHRAEGAIAAEDRAELRRESATLARLNHGGDAKARMSWFRLRWWKIREQLAGTSGRPIPDVLITGRRRLCWLTVLSFLGPLLTV